MSTAFKFKQFSVAQDRCAMKIGTDGVLLGAWASVAHQPFSVLDIGAGTGVLSLMLAQRSNASSIEALEIDNAAYEQCVQNFENSPWSDRMFCYHASLLEFAEEIDDNYDSIICNPPFYKPTLPSASLPNREMLISDSRKKARFQDAMPFEHLVHGVSKLLSEDGVFSVVIPFNEEERFTTLASKVGLHLNRVCHVKGTPNAEVKRSLMEFSFQKTELQHSDLTIETKRHNYTQDYINLTKDFYLKM